MEQPRAKRLTLVEFAQIFGVEIMPEDAAVERSVEEIIAFLADIDTLDLNGVSPAAIYDPAWPRVNGAGS